MPQRLSAHAALGALLLALVSAPALAEGTCGSELSESSPVDPKLLDFARRLGLDDPAAFKNVVDYIHDHGGALPGCYLSKAKAERMGWHPGSDLWASLRGAAIGGDRYADHEDRLPPEWRGRYVEADLDYAGGGRNGHRLVFVRGMGERWLFWVTLDHYRSWQALRLGD